MAIKKEQNTIDVQDLSYTSPAQKAVIGLAKETDTKTGVYQTQLKEGAPIYDEAPSERVLKGDNQDTLIVLGRDRPYSFGSGQGARGGKCGRIHLIAGLAAGSQLKDNTYTGPNLITDASTVYISQRTNIDEYFGLPVGTEHSSKNKSGIGIKADHVRIIGREHVKIYAGGAINIARPNKPIRTILGLNRERNSKGGDIITRGRIDLIADDYEDIQPAVKGKNLEMYLIELHKTIQELTAEINEINKRAMKMNNALLLHQHPEVLGIGGTPGIALTFQIFSQFPGQLKTSFNTSMMNLNLSIEEINYLSWEGDDGKPYKGFAHILSDSVYIT
jgi:hypothetical protein